MTERNRHRSIWVGLVGVFILLAMTPATWAQESGAEMWGRACGRCHRAQPPNKYDADTWRAIMRHMSLNARLTPQEDKAITEFLMGAARPIAGPPALRPEGGAVVRVSGSSERGAVVYRSQCTPCHGEEGKGDGPAAAALTPRPPDLNRSDHIRTMSDEELFEFLSVGKGSMPGYREILTEQELWDVIAWIRSREAATR
jgi:mono/diheme cytochrome c family protein